MINFIKLRKYTYTFSAILVAIALVGIILFGFRPGIDFVGGSLLEIDFKGQEIDSGAIKQIVIDLGISEPTISQTDEGAIIRMNDINEKTHQEIIFKLSEKFEGVEEKRFESIGPAIGSELKKKSITAIILVVVGITLYLAWAFRQVSRMMSSWKYGLVTITALIHDVLIPAGVFAYLGRFLGWEIDSSFVVALLVVLGFSVHDTIVVLDMIRETIHKESNLEFNEVVNRSINKTLVRSFNTSFTLILVLVAMLVFGPTSLWSFGLVLLIGTIAGTYSSIFLASPFLYDWYMKGKRK